MMTINSTRSEFFTCGNANNGSLDGSFSINVNNPSTNSNANIASILYI